MLLMLALAAYTTGCSDDSSEDGDVTDGDGSVTDGDEVADGDEVVLDERAVPNEFHRGSP